MDITSNAFVPCPIMRRLLATMVTTTSYGTWLPGDVRGYVEHGIVLPSNPALMNHASNLRSMDAVYFSPQEQSALFDSLIRAAEGFQYRLLCASVESWHLHWLIDHGFDSVKDMVGRLKNAMRKALDRGRIWTAGYDDRMCFDMDAVLARREYIMRHAGHRALPVEYLARHGIQFT